MPANTREFVVLCGGEEDEYSEGDLFIPTDSSEDSVEVKVFPISPRNKRKCAEPRRVHEPFAAPLKKRMCYKIKNEISNEEPFRPWRINDATPVPSATLDVEIKPESNFIVPRIPQLVHEPQPLPLLKKELIKTEPIEPKIKIECETSPSLCSSSCDSNLRVPLHPCLENLATVEAERMLINSVEAFPSLQQQYDHRKEQRNYKNMTRERRIEANARERTRVHTISAAFETLRRSVPSYSHNQKLSKLSVLRIACSYIMTLSTMLGNVSETENGSVSPTLAECIENVTKTIQKEGKLRKKKDESD